MHANKRRAHQNACYLAFGFLCVCVCVCVCVCERVVGSLCVRGYVCFCICVYSQPCQPGGNPHPVDTTPSVSASQHLTFQKLLQLFGAVGGVPILLSGISQSFFIATLHKLMYFGRMRQVVLYIQIVVFHIEGRHTFQEQCCRGCQRLLGVNTAFPRGLGAETSAAVTGAGLRCCHHQVRSKKLQQGRKGLQKCTEKVPVLRGGSHGQIPLCQCWNTWRLSMQSTSDIRSLSLLGPSS